jgi:TPR repeat protein
MGDVNALNSVGCCHKMEIGTPRDFVKAFHYHKIAADLGESTAQMNIGVSFEFGHGCTKDYGLAFGYYQKSAEQGNPDSMSKVYGM